MKIKYRITLLFTMLVLAILFSLCYFIYYFNELNREKSFRNRLRNRALTTVRYLIEVTESNTDLMKKIDSNTVLSLRHKGVRIYNYLNEPIYNYYDQPSDSLSISLDVVDRARIDGEYFFKTGRRDGLSTQYIDRFNRYVVVLAAYDKDGLENMERLRKILLFSFFAGSIISLLTGYYFSYRLVKPISTIIGEVKEISSHNLTTRIKAGEKQDELNQLAATFNQLLDRMQESFEIQRRFISNASHELSTPLAAVSSQIEIVLQKDRSTGEYREVLESVYADVVDMGQLMRSLLEIAKTGSGGAIELHEIRIDEVLLRVAGDIKKVDPAYTMHLNIEDLPEDGDLVVFGNSDLLFSAIRNIVSNACKFSQDHTANVILKITDDQVNISVSDRGIGIPAEELPNIFQPFYRAGNTGQKKGFGLGLALANRIVRLHKGNISVTSEQGKGTCLVITLPAADHFRSAGRDL